MTVERILALDISTKAGWALLVSGDECVPEACGQEKAISEPTDTAYPESYVDWAYQCYARIVELIDRYKPTLLVIEETSKGSKNAFSQKILEWIHFLVASFIKEHKIKAVYVLTEAWRRETGCKMSKEEKEHNKAVRTYKKKNKTRLAYSETGKVMGIKTRKHINIRRANEVFGKFLKEPLTKKTEDLADALLIGFCGHLRRFRNER